MSSMTFRTISLAVSGLLCALAQPGCGAPALEYPVTRKSDHVDVYHGTKVPDPYRWLEDDNSPETANWVEAQNKLTFGFLERIPYRAQMKARLEKLNNYPKYSAPSRKGDYFFFSRNEGNQNQSVLYVQKGLDGAPAVLIDPNQWSADGTTRLLEFEPSKDGRYAVFGVSRAGSDWQEFDVMDMATRKPLADKVEWVKVSGVAWRGDGFYYSRYPVPAKGRELSSVNENHQVYFHRVGTPQTQDQLVFQDPASPQRFHQVATTEDERFAILVVDDRGKGKKGNAVFACDLSKGETTFAPVIGTIGDDTFEVIDNIGDQLVLLTNHGAPNQRVVLVDPKRPDEANWKTIISETPEPLQSVTTAGGKLFATYLKDVATSAIVCALDGTPEQEIALPGPGTAAGFEGQRDDHSSSTPSPRSACRPRSTATTSQRRRAACFVRPRSRASIRPRTRPGKSSTRARMAHGCRCSSFTRRACKLDGNNPTLLYGYGGFNISVPRVQPAASRLLEQGLRLCLANLRGGGEYGEDVARGRHQAEQAERVRRLHRRRPSGYREQVHLAGETGHPGRVQRGTAGRRGDESAAGAVRASALPPWA